MLQTENFEEKLVVYIQLSFSDIAFNVTELLVKVLRKMKNVDTVHVLHHIGTA